MISFAVVLPIFNFATNSIAGRIAGVDPAVCLSRFVDYPPSKGKLGFPRCLFEKPFPTNEKFWLKGVDFSCVSPWNDECGTARAGTLISKRHVIFAKHFPLWKGVRIVFVSNDGDVCPCYIEGTRAIENSDIMIGLLNAEVTPGISPAKILPFDAEKYIGNGEGLPLVYFNREERLSLAEVDPMPIECSAWRIMYGRRPSDPKWKRVFLPVVVGDSGNPAFLLLGNEPVLLFCMETGGRGAGSGPAIHRQQAKIQAAMDELCPGYKLEKFDFTKVRCGDGK